MFYIIVGGILLTVGDIIFKHWLVSDKPILLIPGIISYAGGLVCLILSYRSINIAVASALMVIFNIVFLAIASTFLFKEHLSTYQLIGLVIAIIAILFLELG